MKYAKASNCNIGFVSNDGLVISLPWSSTYGTQIAIDDQSNWMGIRTKSNGTWNSWSKIALESEIDLKLSGKANSSHTHTKSQITDFPTSLPASDVYAWAKASSKPSYSWSEITNKPSTFTPASHTHDYLPLSGGTITGGSLNIRFSDGSGYGDWNEGIRIHEFNNWATIALCSSDNTGDTGTSANTWSIHNNKGNFYITRNGSNSSSSAILSCINNSWSINNNAIIHGGNIASQSVNYANSAGSAPASDVYAWAKASTPDGLFDGGTYKGNIDSYTESTLRPGKSYYISTTNISSSSALPFSGYGILTSYAAGSTVVQQIFRYNGSSKIVDGIYTRMYINSVWTSWSKVALTKV